MQQGAGTAAGLLGVVLQPPICWLACGALPYCTRSSRGRRASAADTLTRCAWLSACLAAEEEAREGWEALYEGSLHACMHGPHCQLGDGCTVRWARCTVCWRDLAGRPAWPGCRGPVRCATLGLHALPMFTGWLSVYPIVCLPALLPAPCPQVGRRLTGVTILSGSVVRIWDSLERVLARHEMELSKSDRGETRTCCFAGVQACLPAGTLLLAAHVQGARYTVQDALCRTQSLLLHCCSKESGCTTALLHGAPGSPLPQRCASCAWTLETARCRS